MKVTAYILLNSSLALMDSYPSSLGLFFIKRSLLVRRSKLPDSRLWHPLRPRIDQ